MLKLTKTEAFWYRIKPGKGKGVESVDIFVCKYSVNGRAKNEMQDTVLVLGNMLKNFLR